MCMTFWLAFLFTYFPLCWLKQCGLKANLACAFVSVFLCFSVYMLFLKAGGQAHPPVGALPIPFGASIGVLRLPSVAFLIKYLFSPDANQQS
mmetsp:Transcript_8535/g.16710  ORF Transcript_8535/g.16710 Transcript_8535/m.16710 type:complete len:92 (+) Transcript_8535:432-707(+)